MDAALFKNSKSYSVIDFNNANVLITRLAWLAGILPGSAFHLSSDPEDEHGAVFCVRYNLNDNDH